MRRFKVTFYPLEKSFDIDEGETILAAAEKAGIYMNSLCGGLGVCRRCTVNLKSGTVKSLPYAKEDRVNELEHHLLACQAIPESDVVVEILASNLLDERPFCEFAPASLKNRLDGFHVEKSLLTEAGNTVQGMPAYGTGSLWSAQFLELRKPTADDNESDFQRVSGALHHATPLTAELSVLKSLPSVLRSSEWKVTAYLMEQNGLFELLSIESGDSRGDFFGVAVDIGTTTLAASLVDLYRGTTLDSVSCYNPQILFGEDVISRIIHGSTMEGLEKQQHAVIRGINRLIREMAASTRIDPSRILALIASGNTTMTHLFLGIDPANIRLDPYVPGATLLPFIPAHDLGLDLSPHAYCACLPSVSSYVGGDITAGVLSCGLADGEELSILMDIGTNGEAVLGCREWTCCCSCSAGPAFEGGGISHGMRAARGAIHRVRIAHARDQILLETLGNTPPTGICGSGLIDLVGQMMRTRVIDRGGRLNMSIYPSRMAENDGVRRFILARPEETSHGRELFITEDDIATLIRSKGALYAGTEFLLKKMGLSWADVKKFYISGGFGCSISIENAIFIGLLPDIPNAHFEFIGNSSLDGARTALLSAEAYRRSIGIASSMTNVELSLEPAFMNDFTSALFLPHTDITRFPRVGKEMGYSL
jgi:uncharacterized 2Fe-2S/4Fe-4S cluster protein (DUF4445 family)